MYDALSDETGIKVVRGQEREEARVIVEEREWTNA